MEKFISIEIRIIAGYDNEKKVSIISENSLGY